ncbi:MAG: alkylmercury lyase family protein [Bacteroidota bacterium]
MEQAFQDRLRYYINRFIFEHGFAPSVAELAGIDNCSEKEVQHGLEELVANHAIVLHPGSHKIWVAHPFALFPTLFWVESEHQSWYGNCSWCSFGVAALVGDKVRIHTKLNGTIDPLIIHIREGNVQEAELVVHFPVPAKRFWDNVVYTCANMLTFESEEAVDQWCRQHRVPKGEIKPISHVWELARKWYGNYLSPDWTRKSDSVAEAIFQEVGFTSDFWKL